MEESCPNFNVGQALVDTLSKTPGLASLVNELNQDKTIFVDECPIMDKSVGGKGRSRRNNRLKKRTRRSLMGGSLTALQIKRTIQFALLVIFVYMTATNNSSIAGIQSGLVSIWSGECSNMSNRLWGMLGLNNPVCGAYNQLMAIIYRAVIGDITAVSTLTGMVGLVAAAPFLANSSLRIGTYYIASKLPLQLMPSNELELLRQDAFGAVKEIQDAQGQLPQSQQANFGTFLTTTIGSTKPMIEDSSKSQSGGVQRKVHKTKKAKKSMKKAKKSMKKAKKSIKTRK